MTATTYHARLPWQGLIHGVSFRVITERPKTLQIAIMRPGTRSQVLTTVWVKREDLELAVSCGIISKVKS